ncbi:MAG TPA: hypothetical protein VGH51_09235 [Candidatus Angelobacter sp.]|jgi:hypothetical protein
MGYWMVDGQQLTDEQYQELQRQKRLEKQKVQEESNRLSRELGAAYAALKEHLRRNAEAGQQVTDDGAQDQTIYRTLRQNLERANEAPRCGTVREDGTWCRSPKLKGSAHCYAHYRMREAQAQKLPLAAVADANAIQIAIMQVQKWLIDDEISEKKAGLLLYSLQLAASNVDRTTFGKAKDEDLSEGIMEDEEYVQAQRQQVEKQKQLEEIRKGTTLPLINTDDTDRKNAEEKLPRMDGLGIGKSGHREIGASGNSNAPVINTENTDPDEGLGKMLPQPAGGEVYANRGVNSEVHANLG